jgi:hypothetical protein
MREKARKCSVWLSFSCDGYHTGTWSAPKIQSTLFLEGPMDEDPYRAVDDDKDGRRRQAFDNAENAQKDDLEARRPSTPPSRALTEREHKERWPIG